MQRAWLWTLGQEESSNLAFLSSSLFALEKFAFWCKERNQQWWTPGCENNSAIWLITFFAVWISSVFSGKEVFNIYTINCRSCVSVYIWFRFDLIPHLWWQGSVCEMMNCKCSSFFFISEILMNFACKTCKLWDPKK